MIKTLTPFEQWMVRSNLKTIRGGVPVKKQVALLRANGYPRIAAAVESLARPNLSFSTTNQ